MTTGLTDSLFSVFAFSLVSSFGFLPHEVRHSKGGYGGHCSSSVIHVTTKTRTTGRGASTTLNESDSYIFAFALGANHFKFFLSSLNHIREYVVLTGLFYYLRLMKWNSGF